MNTEIRFDILHNLWELALAISKDAVALKHWNLDNWLTKLRPAGPFGDGPRPQDMAQMLGTCGTTGCMIGFGILVVPELDRNLKVDRAGTLWHRKKGDLKNSAAVADVLGIPGYSAVHVFYPTSYPTGVKVTPVMVADRLKQLIENFAAVRSA